MDWLQYTKAHTHIHTKRYAHAHSVTQYLICDDNLSLTNPETIRTSLLNLIYFVVALNNNIKSILLKERLRLIFKAKRQIRISVFVISDCVTFASSIWSDLNFAWKSLGVPKRVLMIMMKRFYFSETVGMCYRLYTKMITQTNIFKNLKNFSRSWTFYKISTQRGIIDFFHCLKIQ